MKKPDVITLCETKLHKNSTFDLEGYEVEKSNLKTGKEGILVAAKEGTFCRMKKTYESEDRNIATVEINYPQDAVRFVVVHGPQEDAPQETREDFFENLMAEIERCLSAGNRLIISGDFNAKLEQNNGQLLECKGNGKTLKELIEKYDLRVINFKPDTDGQWTRIQRKGDGICKSIIDYIITDSSTEEKTKKYINR